MNKVIRISVLITPRNTTGAVSANSVSLSFPRLSERTTGILTSYRKFRSFRPFESNALGRLITSTVLARMFARYNNNNDLLPLRETVVDATAIALALASFSSWASAYVLSIFFNLH